MKLAIWALVVVGIYLLYQYTFGNVFKEYQACHDTAVAEIQRTTTSQANRCLTDKLIYEDMNECIEEIKATNNVYGFMYQASGASKDVIETLSQHNDTCEACHVSPPKDSFYISVGES